MKVKNKVSVANKPSKSYGHLNISSKDFESVKDLKIGKEITLTVTLLVKNLRAPDQWEISEGEGKPGDINAGGDIKNIEFLTKK